MCNEVIRREQDMSTDDTNTNDRHEEEPGGRGRRGQGGRGPRGRHGPGSGPRRGGPFGRPGGWQQADLPDASGAPEWFAGRLPDGWYVAPPEIVVDRDEITVVGELAPVDGGEEAAEGRITRWREDTRGQRMAIAEEAAGPLRTDGLVGRPHRGHRPAVHPPGRPGHDPAAPERAAGARHPRRRRRRALTLRGAGLVRQARRRAHRQLAGRPARGHVGGGAAPQRRPRPLTRSTRGHPAPGPTRQPANPPAGRQGRHRTGTAGPPTLEGHVPAGASNGTTRSGWEHAPRGGPR